MRTQSTAGRAVPGLADDAVRVDRADEADAIGLGTREQPTGARRQWRRSGRRALRMLDHLGVGAFTATDPHPRGVRDLGVTIEQREVDRLQSPSFATDRVLDAQRLQRNRAPKIDGETRQLHRHQRRHSFERPREQCAHGPTVLRVRMPRALRQDRRHHATRPVRQVVRRLVGRRWARRSHGRASSHAGAPLPHS
jgi:hypothetical protein